MSHQQQGRRGAGRVGRVGQRRHGQADDGGDAGKHERQSHRSIIVQIGAVVLSSPLRGSASLVESNPGRGVRSEGWMGPVTTVARSSRRGKLDHLGRRRIAGHRPARAAARVALAADHDGRRAHRRDQDPGHPGCARARGSRRLRCGAGGIRARRRYREDDVGGGADRVGPAHRGESGLGCAASAGHVARGPGRRARRGPGDAGRGCPGQPGAVPPTPPTWCCGCVPIGRCAFSRTATPVGWPPRHSVPRSARCGCCTPAARSPTCWSTRRDRCCKEPG